MRRIGSSPRDAESDRGLAGMLATAFMAVAAQRPKRNWAPRTVFLAGAASIIAGALLSTRLAAITLAQVWSVRLGSEASGGKGEHHAPAFPVTDQSRRSGAYVRHATRSTSCAHRNLSTRPARILGVRKSAGQSPFAARSKITTHST